MQEDATLELAFELIRRPSVTPADCGCQKLIQERLEAAGFSVENLRFEDVDNLWAVAGKSGPLLCFAGHTDVVPPGDINHWTHDPFDPQINDDLLYGRGAADMKGSLAAMVTAAERFRAARPEHPGRLALLLTSDEEGPSIHGTREVMATLAERNEHIDWCVVGEPSSTEALGDTIKNGRRGSLNGRIHVQGRQGHVAYPQLAENALHALLPILQQILEIRWDEGDAHFPPTSLQISNLQAGTGAGNVIPGDAVADFNLRYSPAQSADGIRRRIQSVCEQYPDTRVTLDWHHSGEPFITAAGELVAATREAVKTVVGRDPTLSTAGGTSDGRFIAPTGAQVVELGPVNASIHQTDENVRVSDLAQLSLIYERIMQTLLK